MDLYEYQARDIFAAHGVPVLQGTLATTPQQALAAANSLGEFPVVVKAQVKIGGRGKAGGVKLAHSAEEAQALAEQILGMDIRGHIVHSVMVTEGARIEQEYYFSILLDRGQRCHIALCSRQGGMDIETLAVTRPEALARVRLSSEIGIDEKVAIEILTKAGFPQQDLEDLVPVLVGLWSVYRDEDATLVEVNPLVRLVGGGIIALDGKITLDDNARFRHLEHASLADNRAADPREVAAMDAGLNYVRLLGNVGVIGNGAGLVMSTLDVVALAGEPYGSKPANFLDIGGGASAETMSKGLDVILGDNQVKSVFVNVFGGITACDQVAAGILGALELLGDAANKPIIVRLDGNKVKEGIAILKAADHPLVTLVDSMDQAAHQAALMASSSEK